MKNDASDITINSNYIIPPNSTLYCTFDAIIVWFHTGCEGKPIYLRSLGDYVINCISIYNSCVPIPIENQRIDIKKAQLIKLVMDYDRQKDMPTFITVSDLIGVIETS